MEYREISPPRFNVPRKLRRKFSLPKCSQVIMQREVTQLRFSSGHTLQPPEAILRRLSTQTQNNKLGQLLQGIHNNVKQKTKRFNVPAFDSPNLTFSSDDSSCEGTRLHSTPRPLIELPPSPINDVQADQNLDSPVSSVQKTKRSSRQSNMDSPVSSLRKSKRLSTDRSSIRTNQTTSSVSSKNKSQRRLSNPPDDSMVSNLTVSIQRKSKSLPENQTIDHRYITNLSMRPSLFMDSPYLSPLEPSERSVMTTVKKRRNMESMSCVEKGRDADLMEPSNIASNSFEKSAFPEYETEYEQDEVESDGSMLSGVADQENTDEEMSADDEENVSEEEENVSEEEENVSEEEENVSEEEENVSEVEGIQTNIQDEVEEEIDNEEEVVSEEEEIETTVAELDEQEAVIEEEQIVDSLDVASKSFEKNSSPESETGDEQDKLKLDGSMLSGVEDIAEITEDDGEQEIDEEDISEKGGIETNVDSEEEIDGEDLSKGEKNETIVEELNEAEAVIGEEQIVGSPERGSNSFDNNFPPESEMEHEHDENSRRSTRGAHLQHEHDDVKLNRSRRQSNMDSPVSSLRKSKRLSTDRSMRGIDQVNTAQDVAEMSEDNGEEEIDGNEVVSREKEIEPIVEELNEAEAVIEEDQVMGSFDGGEEIKKKKRSKKQAKLIEKENDLEVNQFETRRSQRNRLQPLAFWKNERPIYRRDSTGLTTRIVGVDKGSNAEEKRTKRKAVPRKPRTEIVREIVKRSAFDLSIHAPDFDRIVKNNDKRKKKIAKSGFETTDMDQLQWKNSDVSTGVMTAIKQKHAGFAEGVVKLDPFALKVEQRTAGYVTSFTVTHGIVAVRFEDSKEAIFRTLDSFKVPPKKLYSIKNLRNDTAYVSFIVNKVA